MNIFNYVRNDKTLKCGSCNMPLSLPPILHGYSCGNICGRCEDEAKSFEENSDTALERQIIYEKIAKHFIFPCAYQIFGCTVNLNWNDVPDHERNCIFKNMGCILSTDDTQCGWFGDHASLVIHLNEEHKDYVTDSLEFTVTKKLERKILFCELKSYFILLIFEYKKEFNKYFCYIGTNMKYKSCFDFGYRVEISSKEQEKAFILKRDNLECIHGKIGTTCDNSLQMDGVDQLFEISDELNVKIIITDKDENIVSGTDLSANFALNRTENKNINEELLRDLECPVCTEYMNQPIFICQSGHNVCGTCNEKLQECPLCRGPMLGGRNFTLEKLTTTINYPCMNRQHGCGYVEKLILVREHENYCIFRENQCFVKDCERKGSFFLLLNHIQNDHSFSQLNEIHSYKIRAEFDQKILYFDEKIFILNIRFKMNQSFEYDVIYFGEGKYKYKYEFVILGSPFIDMKITLTHLCRPLALNVDRKYITEFKGIAIPFSFLTQFVTNFNEIDYKIKIIKMNA